MTTAGLSQTNVSGRLQDGSSGQPLAYANVVLYTLPDTLITAGVISEENGGFEFENIKPGIYFIETQYLGYQSQRSGKLVIEKKMALELPPISMHPSAAMLEEIRIEGKTMTAVHKMDRQVYEASKFQSAQGGTATDLLRNVPSVVVNATGEISVRGSSGFVVLLNGKPVQSSPEVILSQIPANAIKNIEIITAPSAKYDPDGKAGLINIVTERGAVDGAFTQINLKYGLPSIEPYNNGESATRFGGDFIYNFQQSKWDFSAGASYLRNDLTGRRVGDVWTIIDGIKTQFPSDGERSFDEVNYSGRFSLGYTPHKNNSMRLGFFAGKRSKDRRADILYYNNEKTNYTSGELISNFVYYNENLRIRKGDFVLGDFDYNYVFDNSSALTFSALYEYTLLGGPTTNLNLAWPNTTEVIQDEYNTNDNPLTGIRMSLNYKMPVWEIGQLEWGYQFRNLDHSGDFVYERKNNETGLFELVSAFSSEVDLTRIIHAGFGQFNGSFDKWSYGIGLRLEAMDRELHLKDKAGLVDSLYTYSFVRPFPSVNLMYSVNDHVKWKAGYSKRVERTTTFKMNPFPEREHSETLEQGDPTLLPEMIDNLETGLSVQKGGHSFSTNLYFRSTDNLINRVNTIYNDTILNRIYSNVGRGSAFGLELSDEWNVNDRLNIFAGGNIYHNSIKGVFDQRTIDSQSWVYSINANIGYSFGDTWQLQWNFNYLSKRNTAQGEDSAFYSPNLSLKKSFLNGRLNINMQWLNMDLGMLNTNEQRITTYRDNEFYTTTNYVYEVDIITLNVGYTFNYQKNQSKFVKSEFGAKEF